MMDRLKNINISYQNSRKNNITIEEFKKIEWDCLPESDFKIPEF